MSYSISRKEFCHFDLGGQTGNSFLILLAAPFRALALSSWGEGNTLGGWRGGLSLPQLQLPARWPASGRVGLYILIRQAVGRISREPSAKLKPLRNRLLKLEREKSQLFGEPLQQITQHMRCASACFTKLVNRSGFDDNFLARDDTVKVFG
jgi:hypothetical protein